MGEIRWQSGEQDWNPWSVYGLNPFVDPSAGPKYVQGPFNKKERKMAPIMMKKRKRKVRTSHRRRNQVGPVETARVIEVGEIMDTSLNENNINMPLARRSRPSKSGRTVMRVVKRKRSHGKSKRKYKKRSTRRSGATTGLAGGKAILGGRDEEDKQVKSHMRSGVVVETSSNATVGTAAGSLTGLYITHSNVAQNKLLIAIFMALLKKLMNYSGVSLSHFDEVIQVPGVTTATVLFNLAYDFAASTGQLSATAAIGVTTYYNVAAAWATQFQAVSADGAEKMIKWTICYIQAPAAGFQKFYQMDCDNIKFKIDMVSNLVYQNRTAADDSSTSATDAQSMPLFEVQSNGKGTGPISVADNLSLQAAAFIFVDSNTGVTSNVFGTAPGGVPTDTWMVAEPSKKSWINCTSVIDTAIAPGVMKQSKLKSRVTFKMNDLWSHMRTFGTINNTRVNFGKYKHLWFRKMLKLDASTSFVSVAYQNHLAYGVTCTYKRDNTTAAYVATV